MVYTARKAGMRVPLIVPGAQAGRAGDAPIWRDAMQTETKESTMSTILWTAGALAIVVVIAVYMGMS
jgi:hypothetical protein